MKNPARKASLLVALVTVAIVLVAVALRTTAAREGFSMCGEFCQRLGCNHNSEEPEASAALERPDAVPQAEGPGSPKSTQASPRCRLSETKLGERMGIVRELYEGVVNTRELPDGYEMSFPGSTAWGRKLFDFVSTERQCCPFFLFELKFEPQGGPIRLSLRGGPEVKEFLERFQVDPNT